MRLQESPYKTRQEEYRDDPWKMLMVCFMLNQTSHKQVDQVRFNFFERFPTPKSVLESPEGEIAEMMKPLGFYNRREKSWKKFAKEWIELSSRYDRARDIPIDKLIDLPGVGRYALDSWKVFQLYQYDTEVDDHVLNWYVEWAREEVERQLREKSPWKPTTVYYFHFQDERHCLPDWNRRQDYACCVMSRTHKEAIEKAKEIAKNDNIKILGIVPGRHEWVSPDPLFGEEPEAITKWKEARKNIVK